MNERELWINIIQIKAEYACLYIPGAIQVTPTYPEMAVTDIILAKIYRFCQLLSQSRRFFARV